MNKLFLSLGLLVTLAFVSCSKSSPEANAKQFLEAYYTFEMEDAIEVSTSETKEFMNMISDMVKQNPIPDSVKAMFKETKVEIHKKDIKITGDTAAVVPYTVTLPASTNMPPADRELKMVKKDGKWLANYTMMDAMAEAQAAQGGIQQQEENLENADQALEQADSVMKDAQNAQQQAPEPAPAPAN